MMHGTYNVKLILAVIVWIINFQAFNSEGTCPACDILDISFVFQAWVRKEWCGICAFALCKQQDSKCTYNFEERWKSDKYYIFWDCVCSLRYPACNAHAPYYHLWPVRLCHIFPHYLINGTVFGKALLSVKCVVLFSLQLLSETFFLLERIERDMIKSVRVFR